MTSHLMHNIVRVGFGDFRAFSEKMKAKIRFSGPKTVG